MLHQVNSENFLNKYSRQQTFILINYLHNKLILFKYFTGEKSGKGGFARDYKKLGFKCDVNPAMDFAESCPPGLLALDCMIYFARNHTESYTKVKIIICYS